MDNSEHKKDENSKCELKTHCFPEISFKDIDNDSQKKQKSISFKQSHKKKDDANKSQPWPKSYSTEDSDELETLIVQAQENGYSIGFKEGQLQEKKRIEILSETISEAISNIETFKLHLIEKAKEGVVKLALAISYKIILIEPTIRKDVLLSILNNALKIVVDPTNLKIMANPEDLKILEDNRGSIDAIIGKNTMVQIKADEAILPGGCMVETDFGDIDARIDAQFKIIEKAIIEAFNGKK